VRTGRHPAGAATCFQRGVDSFVSAPMSGPAEQDWPITLPALVVRRFRSFQITLALVEISRLRSWSANFDLPTPECQRQASTLPDRPHRRAWLSWQNSAHHAEGGQRADAFPDCEYSTPQLARNTAGLHARRAVYLSQSIPGPKEDDEFHRKACSFWRSWSVLGLAGLERLFVGSVRERRGRLAANNRRGLEDEPVILEGRHHEQGKVHAARDVTLEDGVAHVPAPHR